MTALAAYEAGLTGWKTCWSSARGGPKRPMPVQRWLSDADHRDAAIVETVLDQLGHGAGRVLDVGCGPGRLTAALSARGADAVGIDSSAAAAAAARARGVVALHGDVFADAPARGRWDCALLADGNLGIGGDPVALLTRLTTLLAPGGTVVADVGVGGGVRRDTVWVRAVGPCGSRLGGPMPWAWVGADAVAEVGAQAGLEVRSLTTTARGALVVWQRPAADGGAKA